MFKVNRYIIGAIGVSLLAIVAIAQAMPSHDYGAEARKLHEQGLKLIEESRKSSCKNIGALTSPCYSGDKEACVKLDAAEQDFAKVYNEPAMNSCLTVPAAGTVLSNGERVESETGIPTQKGDSLFFDDRG